MESTTVVRQVVPGDGFCAWNAIAASVYSGLRRDDYRTWDSGRRKRYVGVVMAAAGRVLRVHGNDETPYYYNPAETPFPVHVYGEKLEQAGRKLVAAEENAVKIYDDYAEEIRALYGGRAPAAGSYSWHQMGRLDFDAACVGMGMDYYFFYDSTVLDQFVMVRRHTGDDDADDMVLCERAKRREQEKEWAACAAEVRGMITEAGLKPPVSRAFGVLHTGVHYSGLYLCEDEPRHCLVNSDTIFDKQWVTGSVASPAPDATVGGDHSVLPLLLSPTDKHHNSAVIEAIDLCLL